MVNRTALDPQTPLSSTWQPLRDPFTRWPCAADAVLAIVVFLATVFVSFEGPNQDFAIRAIGAAKTVAADDPESALLAMETVEKAGRQALDELRHRMGILRPETEVDGLGPQPGLADVPRLVEHLREAALDVALTMDGVQTDLPAPVDLSTYRILQEALTNVLKDIPPEELVTAVRTVADGGALLAPSITRRLIGQFAEHLAVDARVSSCLERLTNREREVLAAIARGLNNTEISEEFFIGAATVKSHVSSLLTKLGLRDRAQAVVFAYESGLAAAGDHDIGH